MVIHFKSKALAIALLSGYPAVDAPERSQQPFGQMATDRLKQLLPPGQAVQLRVVAQDRYNRTVAEIYRQGRSVNLQMVTEGQAVVYRQYLDGCTDTKEQYLQAEASAKQQRLGFWNPENPLCHLILGTQDPVTALYQNLA